MVKNKKTPVNGLQTDIPILKPVKFTMRLKTNKVSKEKPKLKNKSYPKAKVTKSKSKPTNVAKLNKKHIVLLNNDLIKNLSKPITDKKLQKARVFIMPSESITSKTVSLALKALCKLVEHNKQKKKMFEEEPVVFVEITCIKIQDAKGNISFTLPHSTVASTGEVCLITTDLKKGKKQDHEPTVDYWEDIFRKAGVTEIKTVMPLRQLRVEYDQFELKRRLLTQHDFIMIDTRVLSHASHILGKMFFKKHNMLIPVRIDEKNGDLKKSIDKGLHTAMLRLSEGQTSTIQVGHMGMPTRKIKENIMSVVQQLNTKFPGGEANIRTLSIKLPLSMSLPLYITLRPNNSIQAPLLNANTPKRSEIVEDELSTIPGARVSVAPDGTVVVTRTRDEEISDSEPGDDNMEDDNEDDSE